MSKIYNRKNILFLLILIVLSTIIFSCFNTQKTTSLLSFITKSEESEINTSTELETLTISGFESEYTFDSKVNSYDIEIFDNTYFLNIRAVPKSESATVEITDNVYFGVNSGTVKVIVSNFDNTNTYLINWTKFNQPSSDLVYNYSFTNSVQEFETPYYGKYKLEVWGAQGGDNTRANALGGKGGYATGVVTLPANTTLYIYVGGMAGFNGGGAAGGTECENRQEEDK